MAMPPLPPLNFTGGAGGPSGASQAGATSGMFDGSNWNVNFSGTQTNSTQRSGPQQTAAAGPGATAGGGGMSPMIWVVAAVLIVGAALWKR